MTSPGPWNVEKAGSLFRGNCSTGIDMYFVTDAEGNSVATTHSENARLIAAAPELRDLLDEALHELCPESDDDDSACKSCTWSRSSSWARRTKEVLKKAGES